MCVAADVAVMYDVLEMIRQLGIPTWSLTLPAANMQSLGVIQTIARQYDSKLFDKDEEKSKWLRQSSHCSQTLPVFQYHV